METPQVWLRVKGRARAISESKGLGGKEGARLIRLTCAKSIE